MDRWEYVTPTIMPRDLERTINEYGAQGWELVTLMADERFATSAVSLYRAVFKRRVGQ